MNIDKLTNRLKANGVKLIQNDGSLVFETNKVSLLKFYILIILFLPCLYAFIFITKDSIIGLIMIAVAASLLYHGVKSLQQATSFNNQKLIIDGEGFKTSDAAIAFSDIEKIKSTLSTNQLFPNCDIFIEKENKKLNVLKLSSRNNKYLNDDRLEILSELKKLIQAKQV